MDYYDEDFPCPKCTKKEPHTKEEHKKENRKEYMKDYMRVYREDKVAYKRGTYKTKK